MKYEPEQGVTEFESNKLWRKKEKKNTHIIRAKKFQNIVHIYRYIYIKYIYI